MRALLSQNCDRMVRLKSIWEFPDCWLSEIPTTLAPADAKVIDVPIEVADKSWSVTCASMGNPHCITFVGDVSAVDLETVGPAFEHHQAFPQRTNTEFIQVIRSDYVKMRVWERGAGVTLACGTGACAAVVAGVLTGKCARTTAVELPGGVLEIEWAEVSGRIYMTGPAQRVFTGCISPTSDVNSQQSTVISQQSTVNS